MRVVADTNTLVSGFGWHGAPAQVVDAVTAGRVLLITSSPLLDELDRVLRYPKLANVFPDPDGIVTLIGAIADTVHPTLHLAVVADEADNRFLEAAVTGQADAIVTGDHALLDLRVFRGIPILTTRDLLTRLAAGPAE